MNVLDITHYQKRYGDHIAVRDLSLSVEAGDIYGFIGHNGAGKTTVIRSIVGAQGIDGGHIEVCGHDVLREPVAAKRLLAYVPDNPDVYTFLTGMQYLTYIADLFEVDTADRTRRITELGERLELMDALNSPIGSYSHGMRQKLVVMSALVHEPKLLVLDEPFVGLDPVASHELKAILHELASRGSAVFFSSHVLEVVEKLCNKVAIIKRGELLAAGPTEQVRGDNSLEDLFLDLVERPGSTDATGNADGATDTDSPTGPTGSTAPTTPSIFPAEEA